MADPEVTVSLADIGTAVALLGAFASVVGGYVTLRWRAKRNSERIEAVEQEMRQAQAEINGRMARMEKWRAYEAGRGGSSDVSTTQEWER